MRLSRAYTLCTCMFPRIVQLSGLMQPIIRVCAERQGKFLLFLFILENVVLILAHVGFVFRPSETQARYKSIKTPFCELIPRASVISACALILKLILTGIN